MTTGRFREEVLNVMLALLLHQRGVVTAPEQSLRDAVQGRRHVPDVLVDFYGLLTVIEGKIESQPDASQAVLQQARERVEKGIGRIAIAILYPESLREVSFAELENALAHTTFKIAVLTEAGEGDWAQGDLDYLANLLRRTLDQLIKEDVVTKAVETLNEGVDAFSKVLLASPGALVRAAQILGIGEPPSGKQLQEPEGEQ